MEAVKRQYARTDPLKTRIETHARHSERQIDLHAACRTMLRLSGDEALLDVGTGPGDFPRYLRAHGHRGRLVGLDQSAGMIAHASTAAAGQAIAWSVGEANALPFADGEFAVISARHMLYHAPDIPGALREFARVVGNGGIVFLTTGARRDFPLIDALKRDMLVAFGLPAEASPPERFGIENARDLLRSAYREIEETILTNAFVFTQPEPIVAYIMSMLAVERTADTLQLRAAIHDWLHAEATRRLARLGGVWRDPKDVGLYRCLA